MNAARRRPRPRPRKRGPKGGVHAFAPGEKYTDHLDRPVVLCAVCKIAGKPGDARHPLDALPAVTEDARRLDARWLGEPYE